MKKNWFKLVTIFLTTITLGSTVSALALTEPAPVMASARHKKAKKTAFQRFAATEKVQMIHYFKQIGAKYESMKLKGKTIFITYSMKYGIYKTVSTQSETKGSNQIKLVSKTLKRGKVFTKPVTARFKVGVDNQNQMTLTQLLPNHQMGQTIQANQKITKAMRHFYNIK